MSGNSQKTPMGQALIRHTQGRALDEIQKTGRSLPCTVTKVEGSIVTVKFEVTGPQTIPNATMALIGSEYVRPPIQVGCRGMAVAVDANLGDMNGLGPGVADLSQRANLTALAFTPIGNTGWTEVDSNAVVIYGPNGVVLRDQGSGTVLTLTGGGIHITTGGDVVVNTISALHHVHTNVQPGGGESGPPKP